MEKINIFFKKYIIFLVILFSIPAVRYFFVPGFFGVSDDLHVAWLHQMVKTLEMLQIPPRFVPNLSFNFGYPLFNFVYPLPFYIASIFSFLGFSLVDSIKLVFGLSIPFSIYAMYLLLNRFVNSYLSLLGGLIYVYAPYRALEIFVRGTIGEIVAFAIFPLIILTTLKIFDNPKDNKNTAFNGLFIGLLILSHNIMSYMFAPFLIVLILIKLFENKSKELKSYILSIFKFFILGLSLSSYFWLPAIVESKLMKYDTVFNFYDHYPTLKQFITPYWGYGASVPGPYDTMSFYLGFFQIALFLVSTVYFLLKFKKIDREVKTVFLWSLTVVFMSIFMMNHRSSFLWENLPLIGYFQFPWRFIAMLVLFIPLLIVLFKNLSIKKSLMALIVFAPLIVLFNYNYFKYSEYLGRNDDYYINRYIPFPYASSEYLKTGEEYLRMPLSQKQRPTKNYPRAYTLDENVNIEINEINSLDAVIYTYSDKPFILNYSKYYFPGWQVKINGQIVKATSGEPYAQITVNVPAGDNKIEVYYKESPFRMIFNLVSFSALIYITWQIFSKKKQ